MYSWLELNIFLNLKLENLIVPWKWVTDVWDKEYFQKQQTSSNKWSKTLDGKLSSSNYIQILDYIDVDGSLVVMLENQDHDQEFHVLTNDLNLICKNNDTSLNSCITLSYGFWLKQNGTKILRYFS